MTPEEDLLARAEMAESIPIMWLEIANAFMPPPRGPVDRKRSVRRKSKKELRKRKAAKASRRKNR